MEEEKMLERLRRLCSRREYCTLDIRKKICSYDDLDADSIMSKLISEGYVSDSRYASAFARDKSSLDGWGVIKIRIALQAKGISREDIAAALEDVDSNASTRRLDKLLASKYRSLEGDPQCKLKLIRFALGRGYEYEEVAAAVARTMAQNGEF